MGRRRVSLELDVHRVTPLIPALLIGAAAAGTAAGQVRSAFDEQTRAHLVGLLTGTRISADFDGMPAREAFRTLSKELATPIIGRYAKGRIGQGIDPATPITFRIDDVPALLVLEMIVEQCAVDEPCTWQLRRGSIEVGTKERLSVPAARVTRIYPVSDLLVEAPYFATQPGTGTVAEDFDVHPYKTAALTVPVDLVPGRPFSIGGIPFLPGTARKAPNLLALEIARGIVETIEPGNWSLDEGQDDDKIARLRLVGDRIVITAPNFIHREVEGFRRPPQEEELLRRQLGVLRGTPVTLHFEDTPAREAFDALQAAVGIPLIGRYQDDPFGYGLDPHAPITLDARDRPAIEVLEALLGQCSLPGTPCTWQMRKGFVEFGTKARLSVPAAQATRIYHVADLIVDIPDNPRDRTRREVYALDVVQEVCENVEPGQWDYGQPLEPLPREDYVRSPKAQAPDGQAGDGHRPDRPATPPPAPGGRYVTHPKPAIIRYWRDVVIVHAPDYIHRQIDGYPEPIPPSPDRP
jgi:hypothetical protein